jgi:membrane protease YdiL (CAAX protease family)
MRKALPFFLGVPRFQALWQAYCLHSSQSAKPTVGSSALLLAVLLAALPMLAFFADSYLTKVDIATLIIGIAAVLSAVMRSRLGLTWHWVKEWRNSLSLTHTAFAVGCIPAVLIVLFHREALYTLSQSNALVPTTESVRPAWYQIAAFIMKISVWAAITEELVYRGMLVSIARRWSAIPTQRGRDLFAVILSGTVFGLAHLGTWGPEMAIALAGLGMGLSFAYITIGELLIPVILYHIVFDCLSLLSALLVRSA